jgi:hypothetical protein
MKYFFDGYDAQWGMQAVWVMLERKSGAGRGNCCNLNHGLQHCRAPDEGSLPRSRLVKASELHGLNTALLLPGRTDVMSETPRETRVWAADVLF